MVVHTVIHTVFSTHLLPHISCSCNVWHHRRRKKTFWYIRTHSMVSKCTHTRKKGEKRRWTKKNPNRYQIRYISHSYCVIQSEQCMEPQKCWISWNVSVYMVDFPSAHATRARTHESTNSTLKFWPMEKHLRLSTSVYIYICIYLRDTYHVLSIEFWIYSSVYEVYCRNKVTPLLTLYTRIVIHIIGTHYYYGFIMLVLTHHEFGVWARVCVRHVITTQHNTRHLELVFHSFHIFIHRNVSFNQNVCSNISPSNVVKVFQL